MEIGPTLASKINRPRVSFGDFIKPSHTNFEAKLLAVDDVTKLVANLSANKADGLADISASLLKAFLLGCRIRQSQLENG